MSNFTRSGGRAKFWQSATNLSCCSIDSLTKQFKSIKALAFIALFLFSMGSMLGQSTERTVFFNRCFNDIPPAPFTLEEVAGLFQNDCEAGTLTVDLEENISGDDCDWTATYTYFVKCDGVEINDLKLIYYGGDRTAPALIDGFPEDQSNLNLCFNEIPAGPTEAEIAAYYADNCGGAVTVIKSGQPTGDNCDWSVIYTYEIYDECGNRAEDAKIEYSGGDTEAPELVKDAEIPTGDLNMNTCFANKAQGPTEEEIAALFEDNCSSVITVTKTEYSKGTDCKWMAIYDYTIQDECGNFATPIKITYQGGDTEAPVLAGVPDDITVSCIDEIPDPADVTATDNCTEDLGKIDLLEDDSNLGIACSGGTLIRTWTATDDCGYSTSATQVITVLPAPPAEFDTPQDFTIDCGAVANFQAPTLYYSNGVEGGACAIYGEAQGTYTPFEGSCGSFEVYYTFMDECEREINASLTVTVEDNTAPEITPGSDMTVECDGAGNAAQLSAWLANNGGATATDNCGNVTWSNNFTSLSDLCGATGSATVEFTATDDCGNDSKTTATFTIEDTTNPDITQASNMTVECDGEGNAEQLAAWLANNGGATASDTCGDVTWSYSCGGAQGEPEYVGSFLTNSGPNWTTNPPVYSAQEAAALLYGGNASDYVTSTDPNSINNLAWVSTWGGPCAQHSQDYKLDEGNPGYNDPDPGVGLAASAYVQDHCYEASHINYVWRVNGGNGLCELSDLCGATGALTVEFTATDSCGNHSKTTATFTVEDTTDPTITEASDMTVNCDGQGNTQQLNAWLANNGGATASDDCSDIVWSNNFEGLSDLCGATGAATVEFTATDECGNESKTTATFTIQDINSPPITNEAQDMTVDCDGEGNVEELQAWLNSNGGATAYDLCSEVTWSNNFDGLSDLCGATGSATVLFTVTDACGLSSSTEATFTIQDVTDPTITPASDMTVECDGEGNTAALQAWLTNNGGATASDDCSDVVWSNNFDGLSDLCGATGAATVEFTATDDCGNESKTTATFTIEDTTNPSIDNAAEDMTVECDGAGNVAQLEAWLASNGGALASDGCSDVTWSNDFDSLSDLCGMTGSALVVFTASDDCGNASKTSATFTIEDTTNPDITPASDMTVECDGDGNTAALQAWLANNGGATASDVCGNVTWSNNFEALSDLCGATGAATVEFTATDDCGNESKTTATFTIEDTTNPDVTAASDMTVECDGEGNAEQLSAWLANNGGATASDTCGDVTWSHNYCVGNNGEGSLQTFIENFDGQFAEQFFVNQNTPVNNYFTSPYVSFTAGSWEVLDFSTFNCALLTNPNALTWNTQLTSSNATLSFSLPASGVEFDIADNTQLEVTVNHAGGSSVYVYNGNGNAGNHIVLAESGITSLDFVVQNFGNNYGCLDNLQYSVGADQGDCVSLSDECGATGSVTVEFTATDACGNTSKTNATFTIEDTTNPEITPAEDMTVECDGQGNTEALQAWLANNGGATASDDCSDVVWSNNFDALSDLCGATGSATVEFTATDDCGNESKTSATFTIEDTTAPEFTYVPEDLLLECDETAPDENAQAGDTCGETTVSYTDYYTNTPWEAYSNGGDGTVDFSNLPNGFTVVGSDTGSGNGYYTVGATVVKNVTLSFDWDYNSDFDSASWDNLVYYVNGAPTTLLGSGSTGSGSFTIDLAPGDSFAVGIYTVDDQFGNGTVVISNLSIVNNPLPCPLTDCFIRQFTATDACGNTSTANQVIRFQDTTPPVIEPMAMDMTVECDGQGNVEALQAWLDSNGGASATDNCSEMTWSNNFESLSDLCGATGAATVEFTVTDACGNESKTSATFTIEDTTNPDITQASDMTVECDGEGNAEQLAAWLANNGGATASDTCGDVTWSYSCGGAQGEPEYVGSFLTNSGPNWTTNPPVYSAQEAAALLYGGNASDYVTSTDPNSINNLAWVSTWGGPCAQHSQDYKLDEGNPGYNDPDPGVGLAASAYVQDHCYEASHINYVWRVNGGNGLCELSDLCGATGALTVEFTATDSCGNESKTTATFTVEDTIAPTITDAMDVTVECAAGEGEGQVSPQAWINEFHYDNDGADTGEFVEVVANYDASALTVELYNGSNGQSYGTLALTLAGTNGSYNIYTASGASLQNGAPDGVALVSGSSVIQFLSYEGSFAATNGPANGMNSTDIGISEPGNTPVGQSLQLIGSGDAYADFTWSGPLANTSGAANTGQTLEAPANNGAMTVEEWLANNGGATASDDCSDVTWSNNYTGLSDGCGNTGSATVEFTATDACGNESKTTATFTIVDTTDPEITPAEDMTVECDGEGNVAQLQAWLDNHGGATASDTCGDVTWSNNFDGLSDLCGATGAATVEFTATDECGNESKVTATFTIEDTVDPEITPASDMTVECDGEGNVAQLQAWLDNHGGATASDDCSDVTWSNNFVSLSDECGATGSATVEFTATDDCGNHSKVTATFTIEDTTLPVLVGTIPQGQSNVNACFANMPAGPTIEEMAALYDDGCGNVVVTKVSTPLGNDCSWAVLHRYEISDECGNMLPPVKIYYNGSDKTAPTLVEGAVVPQGQLGMEACYNEIPNAPKTEDIALLYTDNCGGPVIVTGTSNITGNDCAWEAVYTFTIKDSCNNYAPNLVVTYSGGDTTPPALVGTIPMGQNSLDLCLSAAPAGPTEAEIAALYTDNCGDVLVTKTPQVYGDDCSWIKLYVYQIMDGCGNYADEVKVYYNGGDASGPEFNLECQFDELLISGCSATADISLNIGDVIDPLTSWTVSGTQIEPLGSCVSDNCTATEDIILTVVDKMVDNSDACEAYLSITFEATDACGNKSPELFTCTYVVRDTEAPVLSCPEDQDFGFNPQLDAEGLPNGLADKANFTDNCIDDGMTLTYTDDLSSTPGQSEDCNEVTDHTLVRTFTQEDACGNVGECSVTYTWSTGDVDVELFCGDVITGNTTTGEVNNISCDTSLNTAKGLWYTIMGTGGDITVSTCSANTTYDTKLGVFTDCGEVCVTGNDDAGSTVGCNHSYLHSTSTFASVEGVEYRIYVTGWSSNAGTFELSVDCACPNDYPEISCGDVVSGNTTTGAVNNISCNTSLNTSKGLWYTLIGTGDPVTVSTCSANTNYDTKVGVFTDCGDVCVTGNDDAACQHSSLHSTSTFNTVAGQEYQIYVTGWSSSQGAFDLTVNCNGAPAPEAKMADEKAELDFTAYPVPFDNEVFISYTFEFETNVVIELYDTKGLLILSAENNNYKAGSKGKTRFDLSRTANQMFYVKLTTSQGTVTKKIVSSSPNRRH
ncbi:HYR-like domain-containing protein [Aquaticitalea lipolytica]|nr:T9SS type A sorting domain-containing protein [Aquaticitalea lipolytica]